MTVGKDPQQMIRLTKIVFTVLVIFAMNTSYAQAPVGAVPNEPKTPPSIEELVTQMAAKYRVDYTLAHYIATNESHYDPKAEGDLYDLCPTGKYKGKPIYARGVYQITRCYHPNVTDEQAFDPEFNVEYAMKLIAQGKTMCKMQFTTCRNFYSK
jgi:soluble lytic murein transglycosylase-like protein